jgi:hypothetical protein
MPGPLWLRWLGPLLLGVFAGVLRFFRLGEPPLIYFDETYYAKDAYGLQTAGYERATVEDADDILNSGGTDIFADGGAVVVHPPFGKWMIAGWNTPISVHRRRAREGTAAVCSSAPGAAVERERVQNPDDTCATVSRNMRAG